MKQKSENHRLTPFVPPFYPEELIVRVCDDLSGKSVSGIALIVTFFAASKGDYHVARVTDARGETHITIEDVRESIKRNQELFIMDYVSSLEDCSDELEIEICDTAQIDRTVEAMQLYRDVIEIDETVLQGFQSSVNHRYVVPVVRRIRVDPDVRHVDVPIVPVERKSE